ncbi:hypothetical protein [Microbulbifer pacificus]|uniref:Uncharacterized protein n=1 Tax=Microbulbifer pacificus TaxID=407164 RepID=A0AAU0N1K5_9GAMM|nr:hypothetical protein [Microbulbifer pacificus]WOX05909.1 hypothetical protein R5R33_01790 [Microbulbifer pacificus]
MLSFLFVALALSHLSLFVWSWRQPAVGFPSWFLRCLLLALTFDNLVIALGPILVESPSYLLLSTLRFWVHALVLPWLLVFVACVLQGRVKSARVRYWLPPIACLLAAVAVIAGYVFDLASLELVRADYYPRLVASVAQPPFATIAVNLLVVIAGIWLWRTGKWPWLFAGALQIFLLNGVAAGRDWGFCVGNMAELVFVFSLCATLYVLTQSGDTCRLGPVSAAIQ